MLINVKYIQVSVKFGIAYVIICTPVVSATMNIRKSFISIFHGTVAVAYEPAAPAAVLNTALLKRIFQSQKGTILKKV